ncbi:ligand-binding sensor domain-containing protein [Taibaiella koreensis]|uniref:ligand-binding sensor domain-containing protein n=1 Tax=Taibaiella koreensis TaxID=1268548 RepID=UPI000E59B960|nr:sensor histidine kinase [Taibaiella koreensis]
MKITGVFLLLLFCLWPTAAPAAATRSFPGLQFSHLTVKDGLSTNAVNCIFEDSRGIIWVGTNQGLNRYDGTGFKQYRYYDEEEQRPGSQVVRCIVEDREHQLWLSTPAGLYRFDPGSGKRSSFRHDAANPNSLAENERCTPFIDSRGRLWLATGGGVQLFDYKRNQFTTYQAPAVAQAIPPGLRHLFNLVKEDSQHRLWALGYSGLYRLDEAARQLRPCGPAAAGNANTFCEIAANRLCIGRFGQGVTVFDPELQQYLSSAGFAGDAGTLVYALSLWEDNNGLSWLCIGTNRGLILKDPGSALTKTYLSDRDDPASFPAFAVYGLLRDRHNRLWLATDNGIAIVDPHLQYFDNLRLYLQAGNSNPRDFGLPNNILQTNDEIYLTSAPGKGIYRLDKDWRLRQHITAIPPGSDKVEAHSVNSIFKDSSGDLWYSTDAGLVRERAGRYRQMMPPGIDSTKPEESVVSKIYRRSDGLFWIRARSNGLYLFDPFREQFIRHYKPDGDGIDGPVYSCLLEQNGLLWVGSVGGLSIYDSLIDRFRKVSLFRENGQPAVARWVTDITRDKEGRVWAASASGLIKVDATGRKGVLIGTSSGLPEQNLKRILADTTGCLWIPSQHGIIRFDGRNKFNYFDLNDGLPYQYEDYGFFEADPQGNFLLGFQGIVTRFNPYSIKTNDIVPQVVLLDIEADGRPVALPAPATAEVQLAPGTRLIHIHFALTNYTSPRENKYYYRLGVKDGEWQQVSNGDIDLGSLARGDYVLHLRGSNNDGVFSKEAQLYLKVLPYWYETLLFRIAVLLVAGLLIFLLLRTRIANIRKEAVYRQKLAETEMQLMRSRMNPHFIFNCLNSIKLYAAENNAPAATVYLDKFSRLMRLVLENSKSDRVGLQEELEALRLYLEMECIRFKEKLRYEVHIDNNVDLEYLEVPPMLIQPYVENAIWHGLMHKEEGGIVTITITFEAPDNMLVVVVKDNGIGREKAMQLKSKSVAHKSMGMDITNDRIALINDRYRANASVTVTDLYTVNGEPAGTKVRLRIPVVG